MRVICLILAAGFLVGCAAVSREETVAVAGAYRVSVPRTLLTESKDAGFSTSTARRERVLTEGTPVELIVAEGSLAKVRTEEGRGGYVFLRDLEPVPVPSTRELRENLRSSSHTPGADEPEAASPPVKPRPKAPDRRLIEEANDLDMPSINPLLAPPVAE